MSVTHDTFTVERRYPVTRSRLFGAWADAALKSRWFTGTVDSDYRGEFTVGGAESTSGAAPDGRALTYDGVYRDIVLDERIVLSYEMAVDGRRMSVSILTAEFSDEEGGARLRVTDQGTYLDDLDSGQNRQQGVGTQLDQLAAMVEGHR